MCDPSSPAAFLGRSGDHHLLGLPSSFLGVWGIICLAAFPSYLAPYYMV
ncbi:hypothetical protein VTJ83DRAFT_5920 [Remersonia thermophila]|uniref:Uncharacterized protein n=1 Tax=Remersonia thermophila TaxID=72144 RepID=A0ABR4D899_9PEZI